MPANVPGRKRRFTMTDETSPTWTSGGLAPALQAATGSAAPNGVSSKRMRAFLSARVESIASGDTSGMPPIVQFVLHSIAWCRAKFKGGAVEVSPLRLIGQLPLGGKRSLALIEADGLHFLVGGSVDTVTVIVPVSRMVPQEEAADIHNLCAAPSQTTAVRAS
jgi:flagellar biogenesis protein FliO